MRRKPFECFCPGEPIPQGSKNCFYAPKLKRCLVSDANPKLKKWRAAMENCFWAAFKSHEDEGTFDGPLVVGCEFILPRLEKHKSAKASLSAETGYDIDKLIRAVLDALTKSGVIVNDSRVCRLWNPEKRYARLGEKPGVRVRVAQDTRWDAPTEDMFESAGAK